MLEKVADILEWISENFVKLRKDKIFNNFSKD